MIETYTGLVQEIAGRPGPNEFPVWDNQGERIAYFSYAAQSTIITISTGAIQAIENFSGHSKDEFFYPAGWSPDSANLLYRGAFAGASSTTHTFYLMEVDSGVLTTLLHFQSNQLLSNVLLPSGVNSFILTYVDQVKRNPIFDEWAVLQLVGQDPENAITSDGGVLSISLTLLWNYETGQMISLNSLFSEPFSDFPVAWSDDGRYLLLTTSDRRNPTTHIVRFENDGTLQVVDSADTERRPEFWLGAGNLLLAWAKDETTNQIVYYIAEIIDGIWYETEFLRLTGDEFLSFKPGDWYIRATAEEKQLLSCLFDQSLPARLQIGIRGRVALTAGISIHMRAEPTTLGTEVTLMPEGTEFDVIGAATCANGYRWWQLELDNGMIGWVAEAHTDGYFLEPVPPYSFPTS